VAGGEAPLRRALHGLTETAHGVTLRHKDHKGHNKSTTTRELLV
jgi:hypothetical protein